MRAHDGIRAHVSPERCEHHYGDGHSDPLADAYLREHPGAGMSVCETISHPGKTYYAITPPERSTAGICRFSVVPVYPYPEENSRWVRHLSPAPGLPKAVYSRRDFATIAAESCPNQSDLEYVGISEDLDDAEFRRLFSFWQTVRTSQGASETAFADVAPKPSREFRAAIRGAFAPDAVSYSKNASGYQTTFYVGDQMFEGSLRPLGASFVVIKVQSGVSWAGPAF